MSVEIRIKPQKIRKSGRYSYIGIPKAIVDSGIVEVGKTYEIKLLPIEKNEGEENEEGQSDE